MGSQSYTCTDTDARAHVHTCTHSHTHAHSYRVHVHKHSDPGPWINMYLCIHTYLWAPRVHAHSCSGLSPWTHLHSCTHTFMVAQRYMCSDTTVLASWCLCIHTHMCAFSNPPRGHEYRHSGSGLWKYLQPCHTYVQAQAPRGKHVPISRPSPMCAPIHSHLDMCGYPGYICTDTAHTGLGQWAPPAPVHSLTACMCTLGYRCTHIDTNTQACTPGHRGLNMESHA